MTQKIQSCNINGYFYILQVSFDRMNIVRFIVFFCVIFNVSFAHYDVKNMLFNIFTTLKSLYDNQSRLR